MKHTPFCIVFLLSVPLALLAQTETAQPALAFSGYAEIYYLYDAGKPADNSRPPFVYSFNRHNEVALNLGYLKAELRQARVRGNLALMAGSYANANLAAEQGVMRNVFEANAGIKLSKDADLWLDAGIMPSHIGFESAIGKDCWALTRSMMADNSPYYESGAKLSYQSADRHWTLAVLLLNGWQRIQRPVGNSTPAFGHQVTYSPNDNVTLNSSSFVGNDFPDNERRLRYFHNLYGIFQVSDQVAVTLGFDIGAQQAARGSNELHVWQTPVCMLRFGGTGKAHLTLRGEYFDDPDGAIIALGPENRFRAFGSSLNVDYQISPHALWRAEFRSLVSRDEVFLLDKKPSTVSTTFSTSVSIAF